MSDSTNKKQKPSLSYAKLVRNILKKDPVYIKTGQIKPTTNRGFSTLEILIGILTVGFLAGAIITVSSLKIGVRESELAKMEAAVLDEHQSDVTKAAFEINRAVAQLIVTYQLKEGDLLPLEKVINSGIVTPYKNQDNKIEIVLTDKKGDVIKSSILQTEGIIPKLGQPYISVKRD